MLQNLIVSRTEINDVTDGIKWGPNGEIAINSTGGITFLKPKYLHDLTNDQSVKGSKNLFDYELVKLDDLPLNNFFFKSEMSDERVSSVFVNNETSIVKFEYSTLTKTQSTYLALLTNKGTLEIIKDRKFFQRLNPDEVYSSQSDFNEWKFETFQWIDSDIIISLVVGLKSGGVKIYQLDKSETSFNLTQTFKDISSSPITTIKAYNNNTLFMINECNEIICFKDNVATVLLTNNVFQIYDLIKVNDFLIFSTPTKIHKFSLVENEVIKSIDVGYYQNTKLYLIGMKEILVTFVNCNTISFKLEIDSFETIDDDIIAPVVKKKLSKWNKIHNDFKDKDPGCRIYGMAFNYDKSVICFVYEIKNRLSLHYTIESESVLNVELVSLPKNFKLSDTARGSSFAVYQRYHITRDEEFLQKILSINSPIGIPNITYNLPFERFLIESVLQNKLFHDLSMKIILSKDQTTIKNIQFLFAKLILNYIETNKYQVDNPFDQFMLNNYSLLTNQTALFPNTTKWKFTLLETYTESFNLQSVTKSFSSEEGHNWLRCSVTLLPLLTDKVLIDPIFEDIQIIDITEKENLEIYQNMGPLTKDILKTLSKISIFSGGISN